MSAKLFAARAVRSLQKMPWWGWVVAGVFATLVAILVVWLQPAKAGWRYGACKVILERYIRFPETGNVLVGGEREGSATIVFSDVNPFGAQQIRTFECYYSQDASGRVTLSKLMMDRKTLPDDTVAYYNRALPVIMNLKLDMVLPPPPPDDPVELKSAKTRKLQNEP